MSVGRTSELISGMTFLGIRHETNKDTIDLLAWPQKNKNKFEIAIENKLKEKGRAPAMSQEHIEVKKYFDGRIKDIAAVLDLTLMTEDGDDLLIVDGDKDHYVYFGGMTTTWVYIACWMVVPNDLQGNPKLLFWFLNTYYTQQLENLEDVHVDAKTLEQRTDLKNSPEY